MQVNSIPQTISPRTNITNQSLQYNIIVCKIQVQILLSLKKNCEIGYLS